MTKLDHLARDILADILADFRAQDLGIQHLQDGYIGPPLSKLMSRYRGSGVAFQVNFDLALKQLETEKLVGTGPMEPYENDPNSSIVVLMLFSKREYIHLTEKGYKAAQALTPAPKRAGNAIITNNFHGSVNAVAQGNASIGVANQTVSSLTPIELAETLATISRALPSLQNSPQETKNAAEELRGAEQELREGRLPVGRLMGSLKLLGKAEEIALHAPEALQRIHTLLTQLGLS